MSKVEYSFWAIQRYKGHLLSEAQQWSELPEDERRRRAVSTANQLDRTELLNLTQAYLTLFGRSGAKLSPRTLRAYSQAIRRYLDFAEQRGVSLLRPTRDSGALYIRTLEADRLAPSTVQVHLAAARALFSALRWAGATQRIPFEGLKPAADKVAAWDKRQPYQDQEIERLLTYATPRDQALILLCAHGGLRISEALNLTWDMIDIQGGQMNVNGKGGKQRTVRLSRSLRRALYDWKRQAQVMGHEKVIGASQTAARERLQRLCREAGVRYLGWHAMRHYAGTRLTRQTGNLEYAARHLGHASIETTRVYAKWADSQLDEALSEW